MKSPGPVQLVLVLLIITWASSLPAKESTTRRYNITVRHNTGNRTLLSISNTKTNKTTTNIHSTSKSPSTTYTKISTSNPNIVKKNKIRTTEKPTTQMVKIATISSEINNTKNKENDDKILINNFYRNNIEDLHMPNKTIKISRLNKTSTSSNLTKNRPQKIEVSTTAGPIKDNKKHKNKVNRNKGSNSKRKSPKITTTRKPIADEDKRNKTWPNNNIKNIQDINRYKNYTQPYEQPKKKKRKPIVYKVISQWSDKPPYQELKQSWYDHGIPIPNPNPEIFTFSPQFSINTVLPLDINDEEAQVSSPVPPPGTLLNQISLDMNANDPQAAANSAGVQAPDCPSVHLTNSVFGPSARQECSDLNIAINTHIHQNTGNQDRRPEAVQSDPRPVENAASNVPVPATIGDSNTVPAQEAAVATNTAGTTGGGTNGGSGGLPSLPEFPDLGFLQQLGHMFGFLRSIWDILRGLYNFVRPLLPLLWIFPILSFILGFSLVLPFYPWWLPFIYAFAKKRNSTPPPEIYVHSHLHKPVHHHDGWFWNHNTKTWTNLADYVHHRNDNGEGRSSNSAEEITEQIKEFRQKYEEKDQNAQSWKRRKK